MELCSETVVYHTAFAPVEWKYQTADELNLLRAAYQKILPDASLYGYYQPVNIDVPATERVWKEIYTYDLNGNRETKTTALGTIYYTYDEENRLRYTGLNKLTNLNDDIGKRTTNRDTATGIEWYESSDEGRYFTNGQKGILFTYDKNGNMLSSESTASLKYYEYDATNRMTLSSVTDFSDYSYTVTSYAYDAFGRRTLTQTAGETAKRTLYDGMGFEVLRQGTADGTGRLLPTDIAKGNYIQNGGYSGSLWNDLFSEGMWGFGDGAYGSGQGATTAIEKYEIEDIFPLYANGEAVATYTEGLVYFSNAASMAGWIGNQNASIHGNYATYTETNYFASDTLGSVKVATGSTGAIIGYANYDVFGNPYERAGTLASDDLLYAYTGKTWDEKTGLSNYGFRDYAPQVARFTTVDPIRDGSNWYAYVHNDPVDHVDLWGLWTNNNDGTFTAQKGDTLYGLQQETGRNWESFDYEGKPELLQIGQTVSVTKQEKATTNITIDSTIEAVKHYYNGNGESVNLGDETIQALMDSTEQEYNRNALANGTAKSTTQRYGVDLTSSTYHVGDTVVTYEKSEGTKYRVVTYSAFVDDGFWDVLPGDGDGIGPKKELPGGTPYSYIPYTWTEVYEKEETCNND